VLAGRVLACPETSVAAEVNVVSTRRFTGAYRHGEPYDVLTIDPTGTGESLASAGITVRIRLVCELQYYVSPLSNVPAE
jgi:hypothetical protein